MKDQYFEYKLIIKFKNGNEFLTNIYLLNDESNYLMNLNFSTAASLKIPLNNRNDPAHKLHCIAINVLDVQYIILEHV